MLCGPWGPFQIGPLTAHVVRHRAVYCMAPTAISSLSMGSVYPFIYFMYLFFKDSFVVQFEVHREMERMAQSFPYAPCPALTQPPPLSASPLDGACVTMGGLTLTLHPESVVYIRVHSGVTLSVALDKCVMMCIMQSGSLP